MNNWDAQQATASMVEQIAMMVINIQRDYWISAVGCHVRATTCYYRAVMAIQE